MGADGAFIEPGPGHHGFLTAFFPLHNDDVCPGVVYSLPLSLTKHE